ncbi:hypothetical protein Zm00014a_023342, partial [Zea mays]
KRILAPSILSNPLAPNRP